MLGAGSGVLVLTKPQPPTPHTRLIEAGWTRSPGPGPGEFAESEKEASGRIGPERLPTTRGRDPATFSLRKEVIQPQVLLRLPCYDFTPIMDHTLGRCLLAVSLRTSSTTHFRDVTGGVYKARERIHATVLM